MPLIKATVAYDGGGFHGFAVNDGVRTVAGELEDALATVVGVPVSVTCAGRTDKGVHARGQVISFELPGMGDGHGVTFDIEALQRSLNGLCGPSIVLRELQRAPLSFDARHSAKWRKYRYNVLNSSNADPMLSGRSWQVFDPLDVSAMKEATSHLVGEHDFSSFCRRPKADAGAPEPSMVRDVQDARWEMGGGDYSRTLTFWVRASSFCHQMVRSFVGTTVDVGLGKLDAAEVLKILAAQDRQAAGRVAPPEGLTLWEVGY